MLHQRASCNTVLTRLAIDLSRAQVGQSERGFREVSTSSIPRIELLARCAKERPQAGYELGFLAIKLSLDQP